ncbi:sugar ABC transporter ATP-binding protein [Agathobaculum sp. NTUH-O15-33]|uniref:sugar ABC transporter ATP-binding protein n=1 Tax=Agathobaculum sp. NTUH-O15-33 TaxID=3079302 RepID=UPI002958D68D|nr:sugar ABC transporter ATP-binding protein [Agathobaculum sp. NTUH-O15-33]WNX83391.1 sugar ABC transporter ATP-binding protein [Agathobaculum sp. NTUH-O15-33]
MALVEFKNVSIQFPGVRALDGVSFGIEKGEVMALCGENGAGKSTLAKILAGVNPKRAYEGQVIFKGEELENRLSVDAERKGIFLVHQELALLQDMTVAENIFLSHYPTKFGVLDKKTMNEKAKECLTEVGLDIDPQVKIRSLTVAMQQMVEIAKALSEQGEIVIFDESTSSLTNKEIDGFFEIVRALKKKGVTCIFVTHKLDEIFQICDTVTVLKDGKLIQAGIDIKTINKDDVVQLMIGRDLKNMYPQKPTYQADAPVVFEVKNWNLFDAHLPERKIIDNFSFQIKQGEILGFYGLVGAGRTELVNSIFEGVNKFTSGEVYLHGQKIEIRSTSDAVKHGIALITEDRKGNGLVLNHSINDNLTAPSLPTLTKKFGVLDFEEEAKRNDAMIKQMEVRISTKRQTASSLSGGNQQKVVVGKWLLTDPKVLILDEPTKGIDVGTKAEIYKKLRKLAEQGIAILIVSSELPETIGNCDRVIVVRGGCNAGEMIGDAITEESLFRIAIGRE